MIEKQFGTLYGPAMQLGHKTACIVNLQAELDRRMGRAFWPGCKDDVRRDRKRGGNRLTARAVWSPFRDFLWILTH